MKIEKMFEVAKKACYDQEFGWAYQGYTGGNAVSKFFDDKYGVNLAAGWNSRLHDAVADLIAEEA